MSAEKKEPTGGSPIGYGKPPRHTQFKKGQSGNPTGRPKGTPNLATALQRALSAQVVVNEGGQRRTVIKLEATVTQLVNKATMGDPRATKLVFDIEHVIDNEPSELDPLSLNLTESDALVMDHLMERIRTTMKGERPDDLHT